MKKNKSKMNVRFTSYWTIGVIIMFSASVNAQSTKWVDQSGGNDANDGNTEATAYASLQYAVDNSISGTSTTQSVINVKDGTYEATGLINSGGFSTALLISSLDYLTIQAVSGHNPQVKPSTAANIVSVSLDNSDHIIIDNIDSDQTVAQFDNYHVNNSDDITVKNCTFEGGEDGIDFNSDLTSALIENNTFLNIVNGSGDEVLDFTDASYSGVTIQDNLFENNYRHITLNEGSGKTISNFIIRRNTMNGTTSEEAIRLIGVSDIILENNVILNNLQQGIYIDTGCSNITIQHNSFYNNDQEAAGNGEIRTKVTTADIIVKNNIFYANGSNPVFETSVSSLPGEDFNLVYNYGGTFTFSPNTIDGIDPEFMSIVPGSEDLHLQNTSIAIGAGTNLGVSDDHDQNARPQPVASNPDLGAYESGNDVPVPVELTSF
ncbi:right-handed parallel beta-helix repeat-containing protein, partial [candidate division KSB1 bacterium]|nr:right-handed parallel beta-helix repeat-containing protein [candidate division KSB1 bacterium]